MSTVQNFCTLFDSNYLPRALVLYHSLEKTGEDFRLYALCLDNTALQILDSLDFPRLITVSMDAFESPRLLAVKGQRTVAEYCWTCTPFVIGYVLDAHKLSQVTYLDADLCFYDRPSCLLDEFKASGASVLITDHRYTPRYDQSATSGKYCVQFMTFRADDPATRVLEWWQDRCIEWCYARFEDGKFGDQKYLDDWTQRFEGIHVLQHPGGGIAPWNVQQYEVRQRSGKLYINGTPLIFYHFHAYKYFKDGIHSFSANYLLADEVVNLLYRPYAHDLIRAYAEIHGLYPDFDMGWSGRGKPLREAAVYIKRKLYGVVNEYRIV